MATNSTIPENDEGEAAVRTGEEGVESVNPSLEDILNEELPTDDINEFARAEPNPSPEAAAVEETSDDKQDASESSDTSDLGSAEDGAEDTGQSGASEADATSASDDLAPLDNWDADTKNKYEAIKDPAAKALVKDMWSNLQGGVTKKHKELESHVRIGQTIDQALDEQSRLMLQAQGKTTDQFASQLVGLWKYSQSNPVEYLKMAMQNMGIQPEQLGAAVTEQKQPEPVSLLEEAGIDPELASPDTLALAQVFQKQLAAVQENIQTTVQQNNVQTTAQQFQNTMDAFEKTPKDDGTLAYPHFGALKSHVVSILSANPALELNEQGLKQAYDAALYSHPILGQEAIKALGSSSQQAASANSDADKVLEKAKKAAAPVTPKSSENSDRNIEPSRNASSHQVLSDLVDQAIDTTIGA